VTLGLALCLQAALQMAGTTNTAAAVALAALGVATLLTYLKDPTWPWVTATVVASTALVFLIAGETLGPAVAFLVAGLALLGGAAVVVLLRRRRAGSAGR
jgi:LPXTG-motif cell wall-anchored protein